MKLFVCLVSIALVIGSLATSSASSSGAASSSSVVSNTNADAESESQSANSAQLNSNVDYSRFRKAAYGAPSGGYGGASIPAPPCPKNYLFSCQPNLAPVPCAAPAASYGSAGAYSAPVPTYINSPLGNTYGVPQTYGSFAPQPYSQFYQY